MNIRFYFLVFLLMNLSALISLAEPYKPVFPSPLLMEEMHQLGRLSRDRKMETLRNLSPEKKKIYADAYRNFDPELSCLDPRQQTFQFDTLLALDDAITGRYLVREFEKNRVERIESYLVQWYSPEAVAAFARASMSEAPYPYTGEQPISFISAGFMLGLVSNVNGFPPQVREWARSVERDRAAFFDKIQREDEAVPLKNRVYRWDNVYRPYDRHREVAQNWWRANEKAVTEGRLQDTVPGEFFVSPSKFLQGVTEVWRPSDEPHLQAAHQTKAGAAGQSSSPANQQNVTETESKQASHYAIYAGLAACVAAIIFVLRKRGLKK